MVMLHESVCQFPLFPMALFEAWLYCIVLQKGWYHIVLIALMKISWSVFAVILSGNLCFWDGQVIELPFALYSTFVIEARHGFNKVRPVFYPQKYALELIWYPLCSVCNYWHGQVDIM
jgi:hypothetical protein